MKNKSIIIVVCVLILIIVIGALVYFNVKNKQPETKIQANTSNQSNNLNLSDAEKFDAVYAIMSLLDKTKCSELEIQEQTLCVDGIDLIEKAIAANDTAVCLDKINMDRRIEYLCIQDVRMRRTG